MTDTMLPEGTEEPTAIPAAPAKAPLYKRPLVLIIAGAAVAVVVIAIVVLVVVSVSRPSDLQQAATTCKLTHSAYAEVADGGKTLTLDGASQAGGDGLSITQLACVLRSLKVTDAVVTQMDSTTSLQGRQTGSWSDVNASWTYHPDNGLDIILTSK
jgi:hypothetical protein